MRNQEQVTNSPPHPRLKIVVKLVIFVVLLIMLTYVALIYYDFTASGN